MILIDPCAAAVHVCECVELHPRLVRLSLSPHAQGVAGGGGVAEAEAKRRHLTETQVPVVLRGLRSALSVSCDWTRAEAGSCLSVVSFKTMRWRRTMPAGVFFLCDSLGGVADVSSFRQQW